MHTTTAETAEMRYAGQQRQPRPRKDDSDRTYHESPHSRQHEVTKAIGEPKEHEIVKEEKKKRKRKKQRSQRGNKSVQPTTRRSDSAFPACLVAPRNFARISDVSQCTQALRHCSFSSLSSFFFLFVWPFQKESRYRDATAEVEWPPLQK